MSEIAVIDTPTLLGAWVSIFLTVCILSFLYDDNPVYKLAEHLFLGVSLGIGTVEVYYGVFKPNLLDKLLSGARISWIPLALVLLLLSKALLPGRAWLARIPIAFVVAAYAGVKLTGEANANLMTQVAESMPDLGALWRAHGLFDLEADGAGLLSGLVLVFGLCACLLHFTFSSTHGRAMRLVSRTGVLILMLSFGASFGYTVMGRISLAIGRAQELLGLDRPASEVAQIHPVAATLISVALVVGIQAVSRRRPGSASAGDPPTPR